MPTHTQSYKYTKGVLICGHILGCFKGHIWLWSALLGSVGIFFDSCCHELNMENMLCIGGLRGMWNWDKIGCKIAVNRCFPLIKTLTTLYCPLHLQYASSCPTPHYHSNIIILVYNIGVATLMRGLYTCCEVSHGTVIWEYQREQDGDRLGSFFQSFFKSVVFSVWKYELLSSCLDFVILFSQNPALVLIQLLLICRFALLQHCCTDFPAPASVVLFNMLLVSRVKCLLSHFCSWIFWARTQLSKIPQLIEGHV